MLKKLITILSGPSLGHVFTLLATPLLVELYSVDAFGELGFVIAMTGLFVSFSCLRFDSIMMVCESNEINYIYKIGMLSLILTSSLITIIIFLFGYAYWYVIFFNILSNGAILLHNSYLIRRDCYFESAIIKFFFVIQVPLIQIALGFFDIKDGMVLALVLSSAIFQLYFLYYFVFSISPNIEVNNKELLYKYKSFYSVNTISMLINSLSSQFLPLSCKLLFGNEVTGIITIFQRLFITPSGFIFRGVIQIYNREFAKNIKASLINKAFELFYKTVIGSFLLSNVMVLVLFILYYIIGLDDIKFELFNGYYTAFILLIIGQAFFISVSQSLTYLGRHKIQIKFEIMRFCFLTICFSVFYYFRFNSFNYVFNYSIIQLFFSFSILIVIYKVLRNERRLHENS
ncbi:hypothetical protein [Photobacterium damselae]|uniref:hypothetical protein n=1 Tax=Photobacterium damselae TaxID=38293 RepID=UPI0011D11A10|nr:hypothetical protein [Photobacterium damselae]KAB1515165.1 hypothetical protein FD717_008375 [Photobacterium damselae subsp. damselae]